MKNLAKIIAVVACFSQVLGLQCPSTVSNVYRPASTGYNYSGLTNLKIVQGYVCSDSSCAFTISNGLVSSTDYSALSKVDSLLNSIWVKALPGLISQSGVQITNDESTLVFAVYSTSSCTVVKLNTADGSFNIQKAYLLASQCQSLTLSADNTYAYFTTVSVGLSYICRVLVSDLSMVDAKLHSSLNIISIYSYGTSNVIINSIATLPSAYQITGADMSVSSGSKQYGFKFVCSLVCSISTTQIVSMIWTSTSTSYQLVLESSKPVFFGVNLNTGAVSGSFYASNLSKLGVVPSDILYSETTNSIYILVRYPLYCKVVEYFLNLINLLFLLFLS